MRFLFFTAFLLVVSSQVAHTQTSVFYADAEDTEIILLYNSCKDSLTANEKQLQSNYCRQTVSAMYPAILATRAIITPIPEEGEKNCEKKKFDVVRDIHKFPPSNDLLEFFSPQEIARNFISFVDNKEPVENFSLLSSSADRALAQSIINWSKNRPLQHDETVREETRLAIKQAMDSGNKPDYLDLVHSCKKELQRGDQTTLCQASIGGFLIIYSIAKKHSLPRYPQSDRCHKEKNDLLDQFIKNRLGCFSENTDIKEQSANEIARRWMPEMETHPIEKRNSAAYYTASVLSSYYSCR